MIKLRFIGTDKSMGLRKGNIYNVRLSSASNHIWVHWNKGICPYTSPESFAMNWEGVG